MRTKRYALALFFVLILIRPLKADEANRAYDRGLALLGQGQFNAAAAEFSSSIRHNPEQPLAYYCRGIAYAGLGQHTSAIEDFTATIRLDPSSHDAFYGRGLSYLEQPRSSERAIADFTESLRLSPSIRGRRFMRGAAYLQAGEVQSAIRDFEQSLQEPDAQAQVRLYLANAYCRAQEYVKAIDCYTKFITANPRDELTYFSRSLAAGQAGDDRQAIADIRTLIQLNPAHAAGYSDPGPAAATLRPEDLEHGRKQVRQMLSERPEMARHVTEDDPLFDWTVRQFAGENLGQVIWWSPVSPKSPAAAEHQVPTEFQRAEIRIRMKHAEGARQGEKLSFDELWHCAAFELQNVLNASHFHRTVADAYAGKLSREQFVFRMAELEYEAGLRTRAFYVEQYAAWMAAKNVKSDPATWRLSLPLSFETLKEQMQDPTAYPWSCYGVFYDTEIAP